MVSIENKWFQVRIAAKGAELQNIFHRKHQLEFMWSGDPAFWAKKSPVLFPVVGTLKHNTFFYGGRSYEMGRHGFARDMEFAVEVQSPDTVTFLLASSDTTRSIFPFYFEFRIRYALVKDNLAVTYMVKNVGVDALYFSVGGHPAFKLPLVQGTLYTDYYLEFNEDETLARWPISKDGLIEKKPEPFLQSRNLMPLSKELFKDDAIVFKNPSSSMVSLLSDKTSHGLDLDFSEFPYLGIWAAKDADFVCIEPWCGIADSVDSDQQLSHKEGINKLEAREDFTRTWKASFY